MTELLLPVARTGLRPYPCAFRRVLLPPLEWSGRRTMSTLRGSWCDHDPLSPHIMVIGIGQSAGAGDWICTMSGQGGFDKW